MLVPCAFFDIYVQAVSLNVVRDFVVFADAFQSVHFLRWKVGHPAHRHRSPPPGSVSHHTLPSLPPPCVHATRTACSS